MTTRSFTAVRSAGTLHIEPADRHGAVKLYRRGDLHDVVAARAAARLSAPCQIPGCPLTGHQGVGYLCVEHASLVAAGEPVATLHGRPSPVRPRSLTRAERVESGIRHGVGDECDRWMRAVGSNGYGAVSDRGTVRATHIVRYELVTGGPVPAGLELDHECGNRLCVRIGVGHVVAVTHKENQRRMAERLAARRATEAAAARSSVPVPDVLAAAAEAADGTVSLDVLYQAVAALPEAA